MAGYLWFTFGLGLGVALGFLVCSLLVVSASEDMRAEARVVSAMEDVQAEALDELRAAANDKGTYPRKDGDADGQ